MQSLGQYLEGRSKADFARELGISAAMLSQYLSGYRRPSYGKMMEIEVATGGKVTVQSWAHAQASGDQVAAVQAPLKISGLTHD